MYGWGILKRTVSTQYIILHLDRYWKGKYKYQYSITDHVLHTFLYIFTRFTQKFAYIWDDLYGVFCKTNKFLFMEISGQQFLRCLLHLKIFILCAILFQVHLLICVWFHVLMCVYMCVYIIICVNYNKV